MGLEIPFLIGLIALQAVAAAVAAAILTRTFARFAGRFTTLVWLLPVYVEWIIASAVGVLVAISAGVPPVWEFLTVAGFSAFALSAILSFTARSLTTLGCVLPLGIISGLFAVGILPLAPTVALSCGAIVAIAFSTRGVSINFLIMHIAIGGSAVIWHHTGLFRLGAGNNRAPCWTRTDCSGELHGVESQ